MVIRYSDNSFVEAIIQRLDGIFLRAAVAGMDDEVEFTLVNREWISESGLPVRFDFTSRNRAELTVISPAPAEDLEKHCAAGGDCLLRRIAGEGSAAAAN